VVKAKEKNVQTDTSKVTLTCMISRHCTHKHIGTRLSNKYPFTEIKNKPYRQKRYWMIPSDCCLIQLHSKLREDMTKICLTFSMLPLILSVPGSCLMKGR